MIITNGSSLPLLSSLAMDAPLLNTIYITHFDYLKLHISVKEENVLLNQAANIVVKNDYSPALFHTTAFYHYARLSTMTLSATHGVKER